MQGMNLNNTSSGRGGGEGGGGGGTDLSPSSSHHQQSWRSGGGGSVTMANPSELVESKKLPSSQYKGVVPQPNGRWGAQIYEKHHRVWLGTFNDEVDAAKVYDLAAQRFRGRDAIVNFSPLSDAGDLQFLNSHSKSEIVDMLRKHTYHDELQQNRRAFLVTSADPRHQIGLQPSPPSARQLLFEKTVTPSDVGKLNRLVIPKQHAEKHFPLNIEMNSAAAVSCKGMLINLEDTAGKVWRFRYSYWNSSQSYVLTKGWSRFVKEKNLTAGDTVSFYRSVGYDGKLYIGCKPKNSTALGNQIGFSGGTGYYPYLVFQPPAAARPVQTIRLFGVNIAKGGGSGSSGWDENRRREMEIMSSHYFYKKQCIRTF